MHLRTTGLDVGEDVSVIVVDGISGVVLVGTLDNDVGSVDVVRGSAVLALMNVGEEVVQCFLYWI